jgi:hypothetical protein
LKGRKYLEDPGVDERVILNGIERMACHVVDLVELVDIYGPVFHLFYL